MIRIIGPRDKRVPGAINTTSHSEWTRDLSPFLLGPCAMYDGLESLNMENAWQFSKVYADQVDIDHNPLPEWYKWRDKGIASKFAYRYPKGKGAIPLYSYWNGEKLSYIEARKLIYIPLYVNAVKNTHGYKYLKKLYINGENIVLWDFDGYNHHKLNMSLDDVLHCTTRKMGHAFVLAMMLTYNI